MKEIGRELEEAREAMGISLDEAATDLKLKPSQLENVEKGNRSAFKDVFELKQIIRDYAKYLSLEYEKLEDDFNEFVFEYTSKIPLDEIAKANEEIKAEKRDIISPYTLEQKSNFSFFKLLIISLIIVIVGIVVYFILVILVNYNNEEPVEVDNLSYFIRGE
ncbi:MAG: helix-turn-helix domain-containing protein [Bacilli bacterium]|nr:helix-turn-helix domain-containing protein [Bacilli bacterium]MDD4298220.1 helix-turn-helix domain-containing protein [Bacilli bacterium]MDD4643467.1 helix-turn-helix domain-containing protein [Bacilli bacterium]